MRDDSEEISKNLISATFKGIYLNMKNNKIEETDENGEERKSSSLYPTSYSENYKFQTIEALLKEFSINYFNHKSVYYEPLFEPWELQFSLLQESPTSERKILLLSEKMLNLNFTFAMAITIRKIMDRVQDSLK